MTPKPKKIEKMIFPRKAKGEYPLHVDVAHIMWDKIQELTEAVNYLLEREKE